ncbi:fatty acid desaturase [Paracoccus sp. TK19116]|uniref:Fatty acid desaturase n=1 Tax=Paracoccus albicereus TaxID=2922394 RepID=A0ABT1MSH3_9RHOB|nr:fatty acid desaturase [Paracoccus albicereus]MCQ0971265.1 fatty acid desaturase [Paracoccus albicereus]
MRVEWPTVALAAATYGVWAVAGAWLYPIAPVPALLVMTVVTAMHSSLVHECLHGHPTRSRRLNEALVAINPGLLYPYRRYRETHLRHHNDIRLTDPFEDPESYYQAALRHRAMPRWLRLLLAANATMLGRVVIGPWLGAAGFFAQEAAALVREERGARKAWLLNLIGIVPILVALNAFGIPLWLYLLTVVWGALSLIAIRTYAEHQWHERPDGRTVIVERSPLSLLFLNNNLHIVHHKMPAAPWYRLPRLYRERKQEWQAMNDGYVYPNYFALWRAHAVHAKEPVEHPALYREV